MRSPEARDVGVRRISRLTSWAVAVGVGLTAAVSFVVARAQTGAETTSDSGVTATARSAGSTSPVIIGRGTGDGLQPPVTPPVQQNGGGGGGVATSGGS
jgi:hypothetical protein